MRLRIMLNKEELEIIKSFPEEVLHKVKKRINSSPRVLGEQLKLSFKWICKTSITECKNRMINIGKVLDNINTYYDKNPENGFNSHEHYNYGSHARAANVNITNPYKTFKTETVLISEKEADDRITKLLNQKKSFKNMSNIVGEDIAIKFQRRMIEGIIAMIG